MMVRIVRIDFCIALACAGVAILRNRLKLTAVILSLALFGVGPVEAGTPKTGSHAGRPARTKASSYKLPRKSIGRVRGWVRKRPTRERFLRLARDPAHGNRRTANSLGEAEAGLALEVWGKLPAPIRREKSGASEFVDGKGQRWDVKRFNSHFPTRSGGFVLERALLKLESQFNNNEFVILDRSNLTTAHAQALRRGIAERNWDNKVLWYPVTPRLVR